MSGRSLVETKQDKLYHMGIRGGMSRVPNEVIGERVAEREFAVPDVHLKPQPPERPPSVYPNWVSKSNPFGPMTSPYFNRFRSIPHTVRPSWSTVSSSPSWPRGRILSRCPNQLATPIMASCGTMKTLRSIRTILPQRSHYKRTSPTVYSGYRFPRVMPTAIARRVWCCTGSKNEKPKPLTT